MNKSTSILIVDDEPAGRETLAMLLHTQGYQLLFAADGFEALAVAREQLPDLILLDVMMPELNGFDVCRQLRADPAVAEVPILLVTALDDRDSRLEGIEAGADDFIAKPYDRAELRARVRGIARLNRYRQLMTERSRLERVIDLAPNGFLMVDASGSIRLANSAMARLRGEADAQQLADLDVATIIASAERARFAEELGRVIDDPAIIARFESTLLRADASTLPVELDIGHVEWAGAAAAQISVRDISERRAAEAQRQREQARVAALRAIDSAITSSLDLNVTLSIVLDQIVEQLQVDAASILLRRTRTQTLEYTVVRGIRKSGLRQTSLRFGEGYAGYVASERRALRLDDLAVLPMLKPPIESSIADYYAAPLIVKGQVEGVLEIFHSQPLGADADWREFIDTLASQAAMAIDHAALFASMQRANTELLQAYTTTLEGWARALELRDKETEGHAQRVTEMTVALARSMGFGEHDLVHVRRGALLHDIGKMGIPDSILLKPGPLTDDEWEIMRRHPGYAYDLLSPIGYLRPALDIPYCHHERWDGTGYPRKMRGEQIPLAARIFAVVDVWDALRFDRPYRRGWPEEKVREHIRAGSGTHFDPQVVEAFLQLEQERAQAADERLILLVVDDEESLTWMLQRALEDTFDIRTANTSEQALAVLEQEAVAVIFADQRLPGMSGVQLLERAKYVRPDTLGILTSGYFDNSALSAAINLGNVRGYIHKPWNISELRQRLAEVAQSYRAAHPATARY